MHEYGRWAMLDVMVGAVLIATVKSGAVASISVHAGLYVFGLAVLITMIITNKVAAYSDTRAAETTSQLHCLAEPARSHARSA